MSYFYLCSYPLESGSTVSPGNWGRILYLYNLTQANLWIPLREMTFETIRLKEYPDKPSRLTSIMLCESLEAAIAFRQEANRVLDLIYEVELENLESSKHRGCLTCFDFGNANVTLHDFEASARNYWEGASIQKPELISESSIKIIRQVHAQQSIPADA